MKEVIDERVRLKGVTRHILISLFGICGGAFVFRGASEGSIEFSFIMLFSGVFTGVAVWGITNLINDFRIWVAPGKLKEIE